MFVHDQSPSPDKKTASDHLKFFQINEEEDDALLISQPRKFKTGNP